MTSRSKPPESSPPAPTIGSLLAQAVGMVTVLTLLTGVAYPLLVTAVAKTAFADQANGSLIIDGRGAFSGPRGAVAGSHLLGQPFEDPKISGEGSPRRRRPCTTRALRPPRTSDRRTRRSRRRRRPASRLFLPPIQRTGQKYRSTS